MSRLDKAILMGTNIKHFQDKKKRKFTKIPLNICFLGQLEEFPRDSKTGRISRDKRAVGVQLRGLITLCNFDPP